MNKAFPVTFSSQTHAFPFFFCHEGNSFAQIKTLLGVWFSLCCIFPVISPLFQHLQDEAECCHRLFLLPAGVTLLLFHSSRPHRSL